MAWIWRNQENTHESYMFSVVYTQLFPYLSTCDSPHLTMHGNKFHSCFMFYCGHCNKTKLWRLDSDFIGLNIRFLLSEKGFFGHQIPNSYRRYNSPKGKPLEIHPKTSRDPPTFIQFLTSHLLQATPACNSPVPQLGGLWHPRFTIPLAPLMKEASPVFMPLSTHFFLVNQGWEKGELAKFRSVDKRAFWKDSLHA